MKKLFVLLLSLFPLCAFAYDFCVEGIYYNKLTDSTCEVTCSEDWYFGSYTIPASVSYNGVVYSVTRIGSNAFQDAVSGLSSITIPNSVTSIGSSAFSGCSGLTSITIPNSVTSIEGYAFDGCSGLSSIKVDSKNPNYDSRENCNAIIEKGSNTLIVGCKNTVIPNSVTNIEERAFYYCTGLTSIDIPNSVTSIGNAAFYSCRGLKSISIPNSMTCIGYAAFGDCSYLPSVIIPNSVTSIGYNAFSGCYFARENFINNSSLTDSYYWGATICDTEQEDGLMITNNVAVYCRIWATSVTIPNSVTSIGYCAFSRCKVLSSITIPNSVTAIGDGAFYDCTKLTSVTVEAETPPSVNFYCFGDNPSNKTLFVPAQSLNAYRNDVNWSESFANIEATLKTQEYGLYFSKERVLAGNQVSVTMNMKNAAAIASFSADLALPEGVTIATDEFGDPAISVSGARTNTSRHSVSTKTMADGLIRILYASQTNKTIAAGDGEVATLVLNVAKNVEVGDYPLVLKNIVMAEANETGHKVDRMTSFLTVRTFTRGDVNDDGEINVQDLVAVVNYIMETPTAGNIAEAADINGDGQYDAIDYVAEVNLIMSQPGANAPTRGEELLTGSLEMPSFAIGTGETVTAEVTLTDANATYTCVQMDLQPNSALHLDDVESLQNHHSVTYQTLADGTTRILFSSMSNHAINDGQNLMRLTFTADAEAQPGDYTLKMNRGLLVTGSASSTELTSVEYNFTINGATGIDTLTDVIAGSIYNLNGQLMQSDVVPSGIYVRDGKKMIVK